MNNYTLALMIVGAISVIQMLYGLIKRSKGLAFIGFVFALACALCYAIVYFYGDAIYITGNTYKL
jgi:hypothetical protein